MKIFLTHSSFAYLLNIIKFIQKCSCLRSCSNTVRILLVAVIIQVLPISLSPWMKRLQSNIISNMQYRSLFITHAVYANIFDKILLILLWEKMLVFAKASSYWEQNILKMCLYMWWWWQCIKSKSVLFENSLKVFTTNLSDNV